MNLKKRTSTKIDNRERETRILNLICNTSILLMSIMTEALTEVFNQLSRDMITAITTDLNTFENSVKQSAEETHNAQNKLSIQIREQLLEMKTEITTQIMEKKEKLTGVITDKRFDEGLVIIERYTFNLPKLSSELDERSLFSYFALLKENNEQFTKMFQELLEWMKNLPQP